MVGPLYDDVAEAIGIPTDRSDFNGVVSVGSVGVDKEGGLKDAHSRQIPSLG